jgi:inner membrane protein
MLILGHLGITAGVVKGYDALVSANATGNCKLEAAHQATYLRLLNMLGRKIGDIDYRLVLLGSMLPDIIDKPTWLFAFGDIFSTGRGYAHSLLFNLILLIGALVLFRCRKSWLLTVSFSSFIHLLLDQMWNDPVVLLWPLLGRLPESETAGWYSYIINVLSSDPSVYIPEIIGLTVLVLTGARLVMKKRITHFFKTGVIE